MAAQDKVALRLLRDDDVPPSPDGSAFDFGLQDKQGRIHPGLRAADDRLSFDFMLDVTPGPDTEAPFFTGAFASGPRDERFVYLSWKRRDGEGYVNRIKARLKDIDWPLVRAAQSSGRPLLADMSGRKAGGGTVKVDWRLADD